MRKKRAAVAAVDRKYLTELERIVPPHDLIAFIARQSTADGDAWSRLASRIAYDDHKPNRSLLATMATECRLSYVEIAAAWIREQQLNAILHSTRHVAPVLEDIATDSRNREEVCPKCEGTGVWYKDGEERKCLKCRGTGAVLKRGDKDAREQLLKVHKLIDQPGKAGGVNVQVNNAPQASQPSLADVVREAQKALQGQAQPQLAEATEVASEPLS